MRLPLGTRLGRYEVRSFLGAGGMGEVYLAHDPTLRRQVAIKLLTADVAADTDRLGRLQQEAYAASALNHPNILTIHETGVQDGTHFIATEFIEGENLRQRMARGRLELREVLDIGVQVAAALGAAHAAGIVHRDIKPENIMVRKDGIVKVLDFGLAKLLARGPTEQASAATQTTADTVPGVVLGTVQYMSPEQARGFPADARTDIWSLGVVLYELLAGRSTFEGATSSDLLAAILRSDPPSLTTRVRTAPPELERIVTKALQKDREERYQDAKDLAVDLKSLKRRLETAEHSDRHVAPRAGSQRRRWAILATAVVAATALIYATFPRFRILLTGKNIDSVAVLPFSNEGGDPEHEYLSDGITDALINSLSQLTEVKVIARSSSFQYKGKAVDLQEAARALRVKAIVTGRVSQRGDNMVIGVELVDTADRTQIWGEQYHRKAMDLLQVQADISGDIAENLRRRLSTSERDRVVKRETVNPQAYQLALQGVFYSRKGGVQNQKKAIECYQQAIAIDPNYALAYVGLAQQYRALVVNSVLDPKEYLPKVEAAIRKALELDDSLADAHVVFGNFLRERWDWAGAEREYKRAIVLNPNLPLAHRNYGFFLSSMGRHDQAIAEVTRGRELDPLSPFATTIIGYRLFFARRYDEAINTLKPELHQGVSLTAVVLGYTYAALGKHKEAISFYRMAIERDDNTPGTQIYLGASYAGDGDRQRARAILKQLESGESYVSPGELAVLYAALGEREQAFRSLEKGHAQRDVQLQFLAVDPAFDSLRDDPRFSDLLRRVGLPVVVKATRR